MNRWILGGLIGCVAGLVGAQFYNVNRMRESEVTIAALKDDQQAIRAVIDAEIARLREAESASAEDRRKAESELRAEIGRARQQVKGSEGKLEAERAETLRRLEGLSERLAANENTIRANQEKTVSELNGVRQAATTAQSNIAAVSKDVVAVKQDVSATQKGLDQAVATLRSATGDLNRLSGLIATNAQEIAVLRQVGDRDYVEFQVFKSKEGTRLGPISVMLKKTDVKNQKFSLDLIVGDRKFEKKDRYINEPLQFYIGRDLHEFVVNRVGQDQLSGYLASPKRGERSGLN